MCNLVGRCFQNLGDQRNQGRTKKQKKKCYGRGTSIVCTLKIINYKKKTGAMLARNAFYLSANVKLNFCTTLMSLDAFTITYS